MRGLFRCLVVACAGDCGKRHGRAALSEEADQLGRLIKDAGIEPQ